MFLQISYRKDKIQYSFYIKEFFVYGSLGWLNIMKAINMLRRIPLEFKKEYS